MAYYDLQSPVSGVPRIPLWMSSASLTLVIDDLVPIDEDLPIYLPAGNGAPAGARHSTYFAYTADWITRH